MDLEEAAAIDSSPQAEKTTIALMQEFADLLQRLHTVPKLTIAAVNGASLGGGAGLMAACDLAIAAETAQIGYPEVLRGLVPAIVMHDLCRHIGDRRVREMLLGGGMISARTAHAWGLVNTVTTEDPCVEEAVRVAERFMQSAPLAVATIKNLLDEVANRPRDLRGAAAISAAVRSSDEAREGIRAFVEKRAPRWAHPISAERAP
jgi:methylglutaconyl-CoA hydratase